MLPTAKTALLDFGVRFCFICCYAVPAWVRGETSVLTVGSGIFTCPTGLSAYGSEHRTGGWIDFDTYTVELTEE